MAYKFQFNKRIKSNLLRPVSGKRSVKQVLKKTPILRGSRIVLKLESAIQSAGLPITVPEFLAIFAFVNFLIIACSLLWGLPLSIIIAAMFNSTIIFIFQMLKKRKISRAVKHLPDTLSLISNALKSGYSLTQTFQLIANEQIPTLSREFEIIVQSLRIGETLENCLVHFAERIPIPEVETIVDAILITRETGGNITQIIDSLIEMIREKEKLNGEIKSLSAQGRISAWIIGSLPPGIFTILYLMSAEYIQVLFFNPIGNVLLGLSIVLEFIGVFLIIRIVRLKVR